MLFEVKRFGLHFGKVLGFAIRFYTTPQNE